MEDTEVSEIRLRYKRRESHDGDSRYSFQNPAVYLSLQERERALMRWFRHWAPRPTGDLRLLEIGCGTGHNLLDCLRYGLDPAHIAGNDLLNDRLNIARRRLPQEVRLLAGDAASLALDGESFDVVLQSTVFSSILDHTLQERLAHRMWHWAAPGGGVLWYDFVYNNPRNPDVAGVSLSRVRSLFPGGSLNFWRVTLAPPISRVVTRIHPVLYSLINTVPLLRTHILCWIQKPNQAKSCQTS